MIVTYRYRVKNLSGELNRMARDVNTVWNWANDAQKHALRWGKKSPKYFDLSYMTKGGTMEMSIPADTILGVCKRYVQSREQQRKPYLRYRGEKSLGWVPARGNMVKPTKDGFRFFGLEYKCWMSRYLPKDAVINDGCSFSQDSLGRWYINVGFETKCPSINASDKFIGIDLGLKDFAVLSNGEKIAIPQYFRKSEEWIAKAQRAHKKSRERSIHIKIANQRKDFLHKASADIAKRFGFIAVGNVSSSKLKKTRMAKSVSDAGWSTFRTMLSYKSIRNGGKYAEVNEAYSTQTCTDCNTISGPRGRDGLRIREWVCTGCGSVHDRDHNAAKFILRRGHATLVAGAAQAAEVSISENRA